MSNTTTQKISGVVIVALVVGGAVAAYPKTPSDASTMPSGSINQAQYESVGASDTLDDVRDEMGPPHSDSDLDVDVPDIAKDAVPAGTEDMHCLYYQRDGDAATLIQFCFDGNGKYKSKASYG